METITLNVDALIRIFWLSVMAFVVFGIKNRFLAGDGGIADFLA